MADMNVKYRTAVLTKVGLIASLLLITIYNCLGGETPTPQSTYYAPWTGEVVDANGNNLSVPVLAEPSSVVSQRARTETAIAQSIQGGKARESNTNVGTRPTKNKDSRGAQNSSQRTSRTPSVAAPSASAFQEKLSPAELFARLLWEQQPWREPPVLPGNDWASRLSQPYAESAMH